MHRLNRTMQKANMLKSVVSWWHVVTCRDMSWPSSTIPMWPVHTGARDFTHLHLGLRLLLDFAWKDRNKDKAGEYRSANWNQFMQNWRFEACRHVYFSLFILFVRSFVSVFVCSFYIYIYLFIIWSNMFPICFHTRGIPWPICSNSLSTWLTWHSTCHDHQIIRINRSPEMLPGARQLGTEAWSWHGDGFLASSSLVCKTWFRCSI